MEFNGWIKEKNFKAGDPFFQTDKVELKIERVIGLGSLDAVIIGEVLDENSRQMFEAFKKGDTVRLRLEKL